MQVSEVILGTNCIWENPVQQTLLPDQAIKRLHAIIPDSRSGDSELKTSSLELKIVWVVIYIEISKNETAHRFIATGNLLHHR